VFVGAKVLKDCVLVGAKVLTVDCVFVGAKVLKDCVLVGAKVLIVDCMFVGAKVLIDCVLVGTKDDDGVVLFTVKLVDSSLLYVAPDATSTSSTVTE